MADLALAVGAAAHAGGYRTGRSADVAGRPARPVSPSVRGFLGGVAALLYFCHAITELWTVPDTWPMSLVELLLALWIIFTGNWDGLRVKLLKRGKPGSA